MAGNDNVDFLFVITLTCHFYRLLTTVNNPLILQKKVDF